MSFFPHSFESGNESATSKLDYAATPLRMLALSEVDQPAFAALVQVDNLEYNLDLLERLIPPQCDDLSSAHAYLGPAMQEIRRRLPVAEATCANWEQRTGTEFPLLGKAAFLDIRERGEQARQATEGG